MTYNEGVSNMESVSKISYSNLLYLIMNNSPTILKNNNCVYSDDHGKISIIIKKFDRSIVDIIEDNIKSNNFIIKNNLYILHRPNVIKIDNLEISNYLIDRRNDHVKVDTFILNSCKLNYFDIKFNNLNICNDIFIKISNSYITRKKYSTFSFYENKIDNGICEFKNNTLI